MWEQSTFYCLLSGVFVTFENESNYWSNPNHIGRISHSLQFYWHSYLRGKVVNYIFGMFSVLLWINKPKAIFLFLHFRMCIVYMLVSAIKWLSMTEVLTIQNPEFRSSIITFHPSSDSIFPWYNVLNHTKRIFSKSLWPTNHSPIPSVKKFQVRGIFPALNAKENPVCNFKHSV